MPTLENADMKTNQANQNPPPSSPETTSPRASLRFKNRKLKEAYEQLAAGAPGQSFNNFVELALEVAYPEIYRRLEVLKGGSFMGLTKM